MLSLCDNPNCPFHEMPTEKIYERNLLGGGIAHYCESCNDEVDRTVDELYSRFMSQFT
jgi:hypothetical protein